MEYGMSMPPWDNQASQRQGGRSAIAERRSVPRCGYYLPFPRREPRDEMIPPSSSVTPPSAARVWLLARLPI
jgi:hypothetical protein